MDPEARARTVEDAIATRRAVVNDHIDEYLPLDDPEQLYAASRHVLKAGGKRLRPTILLVAGEAVTDTAPGSADYQSFPTVPDGESPIDLLAAAVSVEVIQSFTLIHDDIMDDDDLRRGVPAVHKEYDTETAILAGDTLYAKAFELLSETGSDPANGLEAIRRLATTCTQICEGQALDIEFEKRTEVLPDEYLEMIELKTAVLYGTAAATAATLMDADDETVEALYRYGIDSGRAFQIQDDVLDLTVPSEKLGKQRGSDLVENKETLITLHARQQGVDVDALVETDDVDSVSEAEVDEAVAELEAAGSIDYAEAKAEELTANAKNHLEVLPDNEARALLGDIADYLITRGY